MRSSDSSIPEDILVAIEELAQEPGSEESERGHEPQAKAFDRQAFITKMFGDIDLAREVAALFLSHFPELMDSMREALASKNAKSLANIAQTLKGSVANIGAEEALATVTELERLGHAGNLPEAAQVFHRLETAMVGLREALESVSGEPHRRQILIADDDPVSRRMLQATLMKWGHDPIVTSDGASALKLLLEKDEPRMAILDWMMPGLQGIEVCSELRKKTKSGYVYVILLTGRDRTDDIIAGLDAGADDYMVKPFNPDELKARVREGLRALDRVSGAVAEQPECCGDLTEVLGREAILVALKTELAQKATPPAAVGSMMARVNALDMIRNDFGPDTAESALRAVATITQLLVCGEGTLGQYADDKILLVLPGFGEGKIRDLAARIELRLESAVIRSNDFTLPITACLGLTSTVPSGKAHVEHVISAMESALKLAEEKGPNQFVYCPVESSDDSEAKKAPSRSASRLDLELIIASRAGDLKRVRLLLDSGAKPNATDRKGNTPLMEAAFFRYPEVVQLLLEKGADVSLRNTGGDTALIEAMRAGHADVVELLLSGTTLVDLKADIAPIYKALLEASAYGKKEVAVMVKDFLLARGYIRLRKKETKQTL
jgi:PleD family two-component response regulator